MLIDQLHDELCAAIYACGGMPPESLLPAEYGGPKADAVFPTERVVVEVKSLCTDRVEAAEVEGLVDQLFSEWTRNSGPVVFGQVKFDVREMPEPYRGKLLEFYGKRVKRELGHANRQIRETAAALGWNDVFGIVTFLTPASFRTHVGIISHAQWSHLRNPQQAPYVNGLINFAVPVRDHGDRNEPEDMLCVPHPRTRPFPSGLPRRIAAAWGDHFSRRTGLGLRRTDWSSQAFLERFTSES
jgi:hypothetical protein